MDVSRNKFFISELLKNSQNYTELLRGGSETAGLSDLGLLKWQTNLSASWGSVLGGLSSAPLPDFTARWELLWEILAAILVSSTEVPAKLTTLFTSLACRQTYAFYQANMYTLWVVTFNVFSTLKILKQCTWLVMRGDLRSLSIAHKLRHTHISVYNYATSRTGHSLQDLLMQEYILLTVGCAVFCNNGESSVPGYSVVHVILALVRYFLICSAVK